MITKEEYKNYFGVDTAPSNFDRLSFIAEQTLLSIITRGITTDDSYYENFKKAILEQVKYFELNPELIDIASSISGASLGKFNEGSSEKRKSNETIELISPVAYNILLNCGLLYAGIKC
jgi:hypothetical protein